MCSCVHACVPCSYILSCEYSALKRPAVSDPSGAEVIEIVSLPVWVLGSKLRSSARAVCTLNV